MKTLSRMVAAGAFLGLAGCGLPGTFLVEPFLEHTYGTNDFFGCLAREYQARARYAAEADVEWRHAGVYSRKGMSAAGHDVVLPWDPANHGLGGEFVSAREALMLALDRDNGRADRPCACAKAQAYYDWWVEEATEVANAPSDRMSQMNLDEAKAGYLSALAECQPVAAVPAAPMAPTRYAIYFGWDRYDLTAEAQAAIDTIVSAMQGVANPRLSIVGHTDTSGSMSYNEALSQRRSNSVANGLAARGVSRSIMSLSGDGERNLAVQTGDGVREPLNRRAIVDILK